MSDDVAISADVGTSFHYRTPLFAREALLGPVALPTPAGILDHCLPLSSSAHLALALRRAAGHRRSSRRFVYSSAGVSAGGGGGRAAQRAPRLAESQTSRVGMLPAVLSAVCAALAVGVVTVGAAMATGPGQPQTVVRVHSVGGALDHLGRSLTATRPGQRRVSLGVVFDSTGSMYDDLRQLIRGVEEVLQVVVEADTHIIDNFILVPYHDPGQSEGHWVSRRDPDQKLVCRTMTQSCSIPVAHCSLTLNDCSPR